jgi:DNA-binding winged helix-turn-helix (wHTH) protein
MSVRFGECVFDGEARSIVVGGSPVHVTPKAFRLLEMLLEARPRALSKETIHARLWGGTFVADGALTSLVAELRSAIGDPGRAARFIRTVHGFGYAFAGEAAADPRSARNPAAEFRLLRGDREIALDAGENIIGRDRAAVAWIEDAAVSRHHARIVVDGNEARIEDLGSKNGTFLQGTRLSSAAALADGDVIRIGDASMVFRKFERTSTTRTASSSEGASGKR